MAGGDYAALRCLVAAAFCAACFLIAGPLVRAAFFAASLLETLLRFLAACVACLESALFDAAERGSRLRAASVALERFLETVLDP